MHLHGPGAINRYAKSGFQATFCAFYPCLLLYLNLMRKFFIVTITLLLTASYAFSQDKKASMPVSSDSTIVSREVDVLPPSAQENTDRFYDSLAVKANRRGMSRLLYDTFFRKPRRDTTSAGQAVDDIAGYERYAGKTIGKIDIVRNEVYDEDKTRFERKVNKTHILTHKSVIRRDLYIKSGDKVVPYDIAYNKYLLLSRSYLADADIRLKINEIDTNMVDVVVTTTDRMSIALDGHWGSNGKTMVEIFDENILGTGDKLSIRTHFNRKEWTYQGNSFQYHVPNIQGTFYKADLKFGREFYDNILRGSVYKDFIKPTDYDVGVSYKRDRLDYYSLYNDSRDSIRERRVEAWAGKSFYIPAFRSSIYLTGLYGNVRFKRHPEIGPDLNPYFHRSEYMFYALGLFREKFYRANMIYGYGRKEYIAEGYRFQISGGYSWGQFRDEYYMGVEFHRGKLHSWGYLHGGIDLGTYLDSRNGKFRRSMMDIDLMWISNLFRYRRTYIRQFVSFYHTIGWDRLEGNEETLTFTKNYGPRMLSTRVTGQNRTVLNTETVFFTPRQPLGFHMAAFGFMDMGLIGNHNNIFDNAFFATLGVGVRFRNERFVFRTLELRLGVALNKRGLTGSDYFSIGTEPRFNRNRFIPGYPKPVQYK